MARADHMLPPTQDDPPAHPAPAPARRGMTLVEVSVSIAVAAVILLAALSAFGASVRTSGSARGTTDAAIFLEATLENLHAQSYDAVLAMNGNRFFDGPEEARSSYAVDLVAFESAVDLLQVEATLVDLGSGRPTARLATLRSRR